jgi:hypothetical protein
MTSRLRAMLALASTAVGIAFLTTSAVAFAGSGNGSSRLQSKLLTLGQFSAGWSQTAPENGVGCLANLIQPQADPATAIAERFFTYSQGAPNVDERLGIYSKPTAAYKAITRHLDGCKRLKGEIDGTAINGTLKPIGLGHYGTATVAYNASFRSDGTLYGDDIVIVRQGNAIIGMDEGERMSRSALNFGDGLRDLIVSDGDDIGPG